MVKIVKVYILVIISIYISGCMNSNIISAEERKKCKSEVTKKLLVWMREGDYRNQLGVKPKEMSTMAWVLKERNIMARQNEKYMHECVKNNANQ